MNRTVALGCVVAAAGLFVSACGLNEASVVGGAPSPVASTPVAPTPPLTPTSTPTPTPTATPAPPDPGVGRFSVVAPEHVQLVQSATEWDLSFGVNITNVVGGDVELHWRSGPCRLLADGRNVTTTGAGMCVVRAIQSPTDTRDAAEEQTVRVEVRKADGSFSIGAPAQVQLAQSATEWDLSFGVNITNVVGGDVELHWRSGPCRLVNGLSVLATGEGACELRAFQSDTDTHAAAKEDTVRVEVRKADGSFRVEAREEVFIGQTFSVSLVTTAGGVVELTGVEGGCTHQGEQLFVAPASTGRCILAFSQAETATHRAAPDQTASVAIGKAVGTFSVEGPPSATTGSAFLLVPRISAGGDLDLVSVGGGCTHLGGWDFLSPAIPSVCTVTVSQQETSTHTSGGIQAVEVTVTRPVGVFTASAPAAVPWGEWFDVAVDRQIGGAVEATGDCKDDYVGSFYTPPAPGQCQIVVTQLATDTHDPGPDIVLLVSVTKRPGSFSLEEDVVAIAEELEFLAVTTLVGGDLALINTDGPCTDASFNPSDFDLGALWFYPAGAGQCTFTIAQNPTDLYFESQQTISVPVEAQPGYFDVIDEPTHEGRAFLVEIFVGAGGEVDPEIVSGPCFVVGPEPGGHRIDWTIGVNLGDVCRIRLSQRATATHLPDDSRDIPVEYVFIVR